MSNFDPRSKKSPPSPDFIRTSSSAPKGPVKTTVHQTHQKPAPQNPATPASTAKQKWKTIQIDLKSALNEWSDLEGDLISKSPEQQQLEKVKTLIENLKEKLNEF